MKMFARNPNEYAVLSKKSVELVGCGSVGSAVAEMLVRAGVGTLTLTDPEALAPENLGRHLLTDRDLGRPKVEAMRERLCAINPACDIRTHATEFERTAPAPSGSVFGGTIEPDRGSDAVLDSDVIVSCVDSYRCESLINGRSLARSIPAVYIGCWGAASVGEILYVVPGKTGCYECFGSFREKAEIPADPRKYSDPDFDDTRVSGQPGLWANILVTSGIGFQVILGLLGLRPQVIDHEHTLWLVNISDYDSALQPLAVTFAKVKRGCAVCDESLVSTLTLQS